MQFTCQPVAFVADGELLGGGCVVAQAGIGIGQLLALFTLRADHARDDIADDQVEKETPQGHADHRHASLSGGCHSTAAKSSSIAVVATQ